MGGNLTRGTKKGGEVCQIQKLQSQCGINSNCKRVNEEYKCICEKWDNDDYGSWRYRPIDPEYSNKEACMPLGRREKEYILNYYPSLKENMRNDEKWHNLETWKKFDEAYNKWEIRMEDIEERANNYGRGFR